MGCCRAKDHGENVSKVLAIVNELACARDWEAGGEIAENLSHLDQYMSAQLTQVNVTNDLTALDAIKHLRLMLQDACARAAQTVKQDAVRGRASTEPQLAGAVQRVRLTT
jgi:flagellar biosynthetic protein FliS